MAVRAHFFDLITGSPGTGKTWLLLHLARAYQEAGWQVIYMSMADDRLPNHPGVLEAEDIDNAIDQAYNYDNIVLAIDELNNYVPSGAPPPDERILKIVRLRRHVRMSILGTSQCPWDTHVKIRKLFSRIYYFDMSREGERWLIQQGVQEHDVKPPINHYGLFDKSEKNIRFIHFNIHENDWR